MKIAKKYVSPKHYGDKRSTGEIKYIVIQSLCNKPCSHYVVRNDESVQLIPDDRISLAVKGPRMTKEGVYHGVSNVYNSLSVCIPENPTSEELDLCRHLVMTLKQRYKIDNDNIIRLKDITGENNPEYFADNDRWHKCFCEKINNVFPE